MQGQFQWAMAGRSEEKLEKLRSELAEIDPAVMDVPILTADMNDNKSLDKLIKQSDVLVNVAGPFWKLGYPLVCAALPSTQHGRAPLHRAGHLHRPCSSVRARHVHTVSGGLTPS